MIKPNFESYIDSVNHNIENYLYYYTSGDTLFDILGNLSIKVSRYNKVNDMDEANLDCLGRDWPKQFIIRPYIYENCCFISFVHNYIDEGKPILGTQHPRMWSQYAADNNGACIVLNRDNLLKTVASNPNIIYNDIGDIEYKKDKNVSKEKTEEMIDYCQIASEQDVLKKYSKEMLLTKHEDWEQEHETRLWMIGNPSDELLSIDGCVEAICLGKRFLNNKNHILKLVEILTNPNYKYKAVITKDAFGLIVSDDCNNAWPIRPNIDNAISKIIYGLSIFQDM